MTPFICIAACAPSKVANSKNANLVGCAGSPAILTYATGPQVEKNSVNSGSEIDELIFPMYTVLDISSAFAGSNWATVGEIAGLARIAASDVAEIEGRGATGRDFGVAGSAVR